MVSLYYFPVFMLFSLFLAVIFFPILLNSFVIFLFFMIVLSFFILILSPLHVFFCRFVILFDSDASDSQVNTVKSVGGDGNFFLFYCKSFLGAHFFLVWVVTRPEINGVQVLLSDTTPLSFLFCALWNWLTRLLNIIDDTSLDTGQIKGISAVSLPASLHSSRYNQG